MSIEINEELARKVKEVVSHGLCKGMGDPYLGQMCVEAAVNFACGLPHGDNPSCVGEAVRAFKIRLNDSKWSSNDARAEGMQKIAIAQLGSNTIDQAKFIELLTFKTITKMLPIIFKDHRQVERTVPGKDLYEVLPNFRVLQIEQPYTFLPDIVADTIRKIDRAIINMNKGWYALASSVLGVVYEYSDKYLIMGADICLEVLIELKSSGCEFLYLCD